jgi:DNA-binding NarL/FixJ family response regulator/nitrogen-specific signal transduction histidine kinase
MSASTIMARDGAAALLEAAQALERAEAARRAMARALMTADHQMRIPVDAMVGMVDLLAETALDAQQRRLVDTLAAASRHLFGLTENIGLHARLDAGADVLREAPFRLHRLASDIHALFGEQARRKGVEFDIAVEDGGAPWRIGDARRLRQVLFNLVDNAIGAAEFGAVRLAAAASDEGRVRFSVEDKGHGIPAERRQAMFAAAVTGAGDDDESGSGLALAVSRRLVTLMGGEMRFEALPDGARISFAVPLQAAPAQAQLSPTMDAALPAPPAGQPSQGRVLVAEDSELGREVLVEMLTSLRTRVDVAVDGVQAVALAAQRRYDLIVMSLQMPGMDGTQALAVIRRRERESGLQPVPVIAVAGGAQAVTRHEVLAKGFADCVTKPVARDRLMATVARRLGAAAAASPGSRARIVVADEGCLFREGLCAILAAEPGLEVVAEAADGLECVRAVMRTLPDLVILDLAMPHMTGADAIPEIRKRCPRARILILTGVTSPALLKAGLAAGADGMLRKDTDRGALVRAIADIVHAKGRGRMTGGCEDGGVRERGALALTRRERQVLTLVIEGRRSREIGTLLGLSERTVEKHRASLNHKMGVSTPAELATAAIRKGLVGDAPAALG